MFRNVLENIDGIEVFPIIALLLFVSFFTGVLWWLWKMDKTHIRRMEEMPLNDDETIYQNNGGRLHG
ncbi:MAG: cbb3-type cytochrome c oxidase subunit 3 [Bacteroidetes bacterium]|nr:cbb3-type cytochrome c oxidase subunit 3 [Bacteroidota bacterium]